MDPKRGNASGARHGQAAGAAAGYHASKTSMASRHAGGAGGPAVGGRKASEVSITPSQSRNQDNPLRSPLDALSRTGPSLRNLNPFQRRSGLQDVDDSFLAANAFARPPRVRNSGLERDSMPSIVPAVNPGRIPAGQEPVQQQQQQQQQQPQQYQQMIPAGGEQQQQVPPVAAVPSSQHLMQQYAQQPAAGQPTRHEPTPTGRAHAHQHQHQHMHQHQQQMPQQQQQQQQQQQPQQPAYEQQQQPVTTLPDAQITNKYPTQQQPQQGYNTQPSPAASAAPPPATSSGGAAAAPGGAGAAPTGGAAGNNAPPQDAEMCTTCPNCQTTIYLVRSPELGHGDAARPYNEM
ncbi:uncharacterized protein DDB_G0285291 [Drosophila serrata]|uniref:uncharacterized protein DDB_G0285291 n=1 Tax=Drosophila serrata TaxID=7274 RepID=UPI000A1CF755|nr:uncharacterized protein DDB_G0285291 [Drosophila serrata]